MSSRHAELAELLAAARAAATAASTLLRGVRASERRTKSNPKDLVTEWDLRSEQVIRDVLAERTPGVPVLGEEGGLGAGSGGMRWLVDPIDGTVNFAHGLPIWSVSIAIEDGGALLAGVVTAPALGWWFEASAGGGARDHHGAPLAVSGVGELEQALLVTGFPYDLSGERTNFREWEHLHRAAGSVRRLGSAALDLCAVACGWFDGYWEVDLQPWDLAAGALIVAEAGGTVTDTRGAAFDPYSGQVLATNGAIHEGLIAELARVRS